MNRLSWRNASISSGSARKYSDRPDASTADTATMRRSISRIVSCRRGTSPCSAVHPRPRQETVDRSSGAAEYGFIEFGVTPDHGPVCCGGSASDGVPRYHGLEVCRIHVRCSSTAAERSPHFGASGLSRRVPVRAGCQRSAMLSQLPENPQIHPAKRPRSGPVADSDGVDGRSSIVVPAVAQALGRLP